MLVQFTKMHGLGNDFVLLDLITQHAKLQPDLVKQMADRRLGIGFDQLLIALPPEDPGVDFRCQIYNADGSSAEQCGNGMRCFAQFVRDRRLTSRDQIRVETSNRTVVCELTPDHNVTVDMGPPILEPARIPFVAERPQIHYDLDVDSAMGAAPAVSISAISMGNPHAVVVVDDISNAPVGKLGAVIEKHKRFPQRVNVGFMQIASSNRIDLRVFERGVGETQACGSGACAAVVAGRLQGCLAEKVEVNLPGGMLTVEWQGDDSPVFLTGPTSRVFEGRFQI
jgi:diaminopimelate epimerase